MIGVLCYLIWLINHRRGRRAYHFISYETNPLIRQIPDPDVFVFTNPEPGGVGLDPSKETSFDLLRLAGKGWQLIVPGRPPLSPRPTGRGLGRIQGLSHTPHFPLFIGISFRGLLPRIK